MSKKGIDVVGPLYLDDFNPNSDDFYDNVIKQFDLPLEDADGNLLAEDWNAKFKFLELPSPDILAEFNSGLGRLCGDDSGPLSTPSEYELKPKPKDSLQGSGEATSARNIFFDGIKDSGLFQTTSSSVSVLDSGGSWSGDNSLHLGFRFFIPVKRARSKRMRPHTLNPRLTSIPFIHSAEKEKGKKKKNLCVISGRRNNNESTLLFNGIRKCSHCEVTKTPQWREGPMGPKTLCNACGVRYRSGRLFPEYRPAASPTFVASQHSNSHKKVIEMRKKVTCDGAVEDDSPAASPTFVASQHSNSHNVIEMRKKMTSDGAVEDDSLRLPIPKLGNYPNGCLSV